jgi:hypothetical protein
MSWKKGATGKPYWEAEGSSTTIKGEGTFDADKVAASEKEDENRKKLQAEMKKRGTAVESESPPSKEPDEGLGAYSERLRKWREGNAALQGQKKALK